MADKKPFSEVLKFIEQHWVGGSFLAIKPWRHEFLSALRDDLGVPVCAVVGDIKWIQRAKLGGCTVWCYHYTLHGQSLNALDGICKEHEVTSAIIYPEAHGDDFAQIIEKLYELDVKELFILTHQPATYLTKLNMRYSVQRCEAEMWHLMKTKGNSNL